MLQHFFLTTDIINFVISEQAVNKQLILTIFLVEMTVKTKLNQDLKEEREKIPFNVEEFTNWYYGGAANVKDKIYLGKWIHGVGVFYNWKLVTYSLFPL